MIRALLFLRGLWRLKRGFCAYCDSSPPRPECPVCMGDNEYFGARNKQKRQTLWRERWEKIFEVLK